MRSRILLVDDHQIVREGVKSVLARNPELTVCAEAQNGKEAIEKVLALKPDLVLMDLSMPEMGGIEATRQIRLFAPGTRVVILSFHDSAQFAAAAKAAGAHAYVVKNRSAEELLETIAAALHPNGRHVPAPDSQTVRATLGRHRKLPSTEPA